MTWHLKDRELEKTIEKYSGSKFVNALNHAIEQENIDSECIVYVEFGRKFLGEDFAENCLCFRTDELEDIPEYNPHDWNDFPDTTPPENVLMRVETTGSKFCGYYHTFAEGGFWCYEDRTVCPEAISKSVKRYRPWE